MADSVGKFVWYDLMTTDIKAAESFYCKAISWTAKDSGMAGNPYILFSAGTSMVAGLMPMPDDAHAMKVPPCWNGYIHVDNVDVYATRVTAAGGKVLRPPQDIPNVGRFAVAADPHGAVFLLFKGTSEQGPAPAPAGTPGHVGWHELYAGNLDAAWSFYSGLFGWTKAEAVDMGQMGIYQTFATGGPQVGGMMTKPPQIPVPCWVYYFNVDAADAAVTRVKEAGGKVVNGPSQVPGGSWIVQCFDPQGAFFAVVAPKR